MKALRKKAIIFLTDIVAVIIYAVKKTIIFFIRKKSKRGLRVLLYHSVREIPCVLDPDEKNVSPSMFKKHIEILKKISKKIVSLKEGVESLGNENIGEGSIAITFDDGLENTYGEALKILEEFEIPATFFITYKYAGEKDFMDWPEILSLKEKGFEIGAHSYSHRRLSRLNDEELNKETSFIKKKFEEKGINPEYFAYPYGFYGDFSEKTGDAIRNSGYKACFTGIMGENGSGENLFELKRTRVSWRDNAFRFRMKIEGAYDWVDAVKIFFHTGSG